MRVPGASRARGADRALPCRSHRPAALLPLVLLVPLALAGGCTLAPPREDIAARVARIEPAALGDHVRELAALGPRDEGNEAACRATLDLLAARLRTWGWEVREEPYLGVVVEMAPKYVEAPDGSLVQDGWRGSTPIRVNSNLLAEKRGRVDDVVVELGAHFDTHAWTVGADDNTSGVAALLEVARACADLQPDRTLRLCFFNGEERGLKGSAAHAAALAESGEALDAALVLDTVGFTSRAPGSQDAPVRIPLLAWMPETADFVFLAGNWDSGPVADDFEDAAERYVPALRTWGVKRIAGWFKDSERSDHASYWHHDLRAVLLTDTANFRNPHYHQPSDRPETLDLDFAANVARAACAWALERVTPGGSSQPFPATSPSPQAAPHARPAPSEPPGAAPTL